MRRYHIFLGLWLLVPLLGYGQQATLSGKVSLDTGWARKFYISRLPGFDYMFAVSRALIITEGDIDAAGNFKASFPADKDEALYRLHFIRKGDPASTLIIGSRDVNHVFFIARQADRVRFEKSPGEPVSQAGITGTDANTQLNTLLKLSGNDTVSNSAFITLAGRSPSQLVGLLAINHIAGLTDEEKGKVRNVLAHYGQHNAYGNHIFQEYEDKNHLILYLATGVLFLAALSIYGYRYYKRQAIVKIWRELSQREMDIVGLMLSGKSNKEVAAAFSIELSTVKTHVNNIYAKLKVNKRKDLDKYKGLIK